MFVGTVLILIVAVYMRRHKPKLHGVYVDPNDDIRENIIHYDEEGVGNYAFFYVLVF